MLVMVGLLRMWGWGLVQELANSRCILIQNLLFVLKIVLYVIIVLIIAITMLSLLLMGNKHQ